MGAIAIEPVDGEVGLIEAMINQARKDLRSRDALLSFDAFLWWIFAAPSEFRRMGLDVSDEQIFGVILEGATNGKMRAN